MSIETTGLYGRSLEHLRRRMLFVDELAPAPICSIGSIIANLRQRTEPFHWVYGDDEDLGLNVTFVSPSGYSKSHTMKQFLNREKGICPFKSIFRGKITEAGFVGTRTKDGEELYGDAFHYREGILAFNEIANLFMTQQQDHSSELINQVMEALTERRVSKRLSTGAVDYPTWVTIWGGIQPKRFDFSQGLGRRFLFVCRNWTKEDIRAFKLLRKSRDKIIRLDMDEVRALRNEYADALETFSASEVQWQAGILDYIEEKCESHLQMQMLEKVLISKEVLEQYDCDTLIVQNSDENRELIDLIASMQDMVAEGSDVALMVNVLQSSGKKKMSISELWDAFRVFNYTLTGFQELLTTCTRLRVIESRYEGGKQYLHLRPGLSRSEAHDRKAEQIIEDLYKLNS